MYNDIMHLLRNEVLIPTKDFGTVGCALVIDRSAHVKAQILACALGSQCVDSAGLAAIGKKGVLGAAKFLSEDPSRQRHAALDLLTCIVTKMNNDIPKLSKICGNNLSDKGRKMVEDWVKSSKIAGKSEVTEPTAMSNIASELPRLSLRQNPPTIKYAVPKPTTHEEGVVDDLFVFSSGQSFDSSDSFPRSDHKLAGISQGSTSAAAALRARLMKIREKGAATSQTFEPFPQTTNLGESTEKRRQIEPIYIHISYFRDLLQKETPVNEADSSVEKAIGSLRIFHNVLAGKDGSLLNISKQDACSFRNEIIEHANTSIDLVRR